MDHWRVGVPRPVLAAFKADRLGRGVITADFRAQIAAARDAALGKREDRTANKAVKVDGVYQGGAAFERDDLAINVRNAPQCYTLAQSYQVQRNIVGPAAGAKISMGDSPSPHLQLRQDIIKVGISRQPL